MPFRMRRIAGADRPMQLPGLGGTSLHGDWMTLQKRKRCLVLAAGVVATLAVVVLVVGVLWPVAVEASPSAPVVKAAAQRTSAPSESEEKLRVSLAELRQACAIDPRRPLYDPVVEKQAVQAPPPAP